MPQSLYLSFQCGKAVLKYIEKYKYLGITFNEHFDIHEIVKYVFTKLYDTLVQSVIDYGAAICGTQELKCINAVQNRAL